MQIILFLISLTALAALSVSDAAPHSTAQGHLVPLHSNPNHKKDFRAAMAKVGRRYPQLNMPKILHRRQEHARRGPAQNIGISGRVSVANIHPDYEYIGAVDVGSPAQTLMLNFDTGSADIWFPSSTCEMEGCKAHHRFNTSNSATYRNDGRPWSIRYGEGSSANGILGSDLVNAGGIRVRQTIGLATNESSEFAGAYEDGIFGLSFSSKESVKGVKTFMDNAIDTKAIALPIFSVFLPSVRMSGGQGGNYLFGAIDNRRYTGELTFVPVTKQGYWQISVSDLKFQGRSLGQSSEGIVDTGTTLVIVSNAAATALHSNIKGAHYSAEDVGWVLPCSVANMTGNISLTLGGKDFHIAMADLAWDPVKKDSPLCYSGVQGGQDGLWILGDVFIKNNYCVFDMSDRPAVGIAPLRY
ncbi:hypothetical protein EDD11_004367 [Mortierella claussenii]|nr:hypothetical protein EDD11_004367 [Mortierella claussenii]